MTAAAPNSVLPANWKRFSYNEAMPDASLLKILKEFFQDADSNVAAVYLFGSQARGDDRTDSDVDVGLLLNDTPAPTLDALRLDLEADLEEELGRPVQLVILNLAPVDLCRRVLRDGVLVLDHHPSRRVDFEINTRNQYWDLEPILKEYRGLSKR